MGISALSGLVTGDRITHEGGRSVAYDLLGTNVDFKKEDIYVYYMNGQEQFIDLPYPSYVLCPSSSGSGTAGIEIRYLQEGGTEDLAHCVWSDPLEYDSSSGETVEANHWREVEIDETSMAKAHHLWNRADFQFNGKLARRIAFRLNSEALGDESTNITIKITYHVFFKDIVDDNRFRTQGGPEYSRELGQNILDRLDELECKTKVINVNMFGSTMHSNDILSTDLTGQNSNNRVQFELHEADTTTGHTLISPTQGSFYPGETDAATEFKMYRYEVEHDVTISEQHVSRGLLNGYLFIYTVNSRQVYVETMDTVFLDRTAYYTSSLKTGGYYQLKSGTAEEVAAGTADYVSGTTTIASWIAAHPGQGVFNRENVAYDPKNRIFDHVVNDTSAVISREERVILTDKNVSNYTDYTGTTVDVSLRTLYNLTSDVTFQEGVTYYKCSVGDDGIYVFTAATAGTEEQVEAGEADYYVGQEVPENTYYETNGGTRSHELILGTDYEFCDVNVAKTEETYSDQPVYDHVRLLTTVTTDESHLIGISYQAFGGEVRPDDVRNLRQDVKNALSILGQHRLLTVENLDKQVVIKDLIARLRRMENTHFHFHQVDHQIYMGGSISETVSDPGFHWINIAQLYDVAWLTDMQFVKEIGTFRVYSKMLKWCFEFTVSIDLEKEDSGRVVIKTLGATGTSISDPSCTTSIGNKENVGIRVCWNNDGRHSGIVLQLGWDYSTYDYDPSDEDTTWHNDTVTVTNKSGNTSHWVLYYNPLETTKYTDAAINVYGHVKYTQVITDSLDDTTIPYFLLLDEYLYYLPTTTYAVSGTKYYMKDASGQDYIEVAIKPNTKLSDVGVVYERSAYRTRYRQTTVTAGQKITAADNIWKIDSVYSYSDNSFTLPNGTDIWYEGAEGSNSDTRMLESDANGILIWSGVAPMANYSFGPNKTQSTLSLHSSLSASTAETISVSAATRMTVVIYDRRADRYIYKSVNSFCESTDRSANETSAETLFFLEDMCGMFIRIHKDDEDQSYYDIDIDLGLGTSSQINDRFDLRQIWLNF